MRIAVSGTHRVGKSTLVAELAERLPGVVVYDEPYVQLAEEDHDFADPPSVDDFVAQLARALDDLRSAGPDALFDRCPLDILAYLAAHEDARAFSQARWSARVQRACRRLDLIVLVGIERPDRVVVSASEDVALRADVAERLFELTVDDALDLRVPVLEVRGPPAARVDQVLAHARVRGR